MAFVYLLCGAMRLARFNCMADEQKESVNYFIGFPIPAAAGVIASLTLLMLWFSEGGEGDRAMEVSPAVADDAPVLPHVQRAALPEFQARELGNETHAPDRALHDHRGAAHGTQLPVDAGGDLPTPTSSTDWCARGYRGACNARSNRRKRQRANSIRPRWRSTRISGSGGRCAE